LKTVKKIMGFILAALAFVCEVVAIGVMLTGIVLCIVAGFFAIAYGNIGMFIVGLLAAAGLFIILLEASK
jgi:hypothetical protein